jgi:cytoskeletal protein CcmA (bactofilin family)
MFFKIAAGPSPAIQTYLAAGSVAQGQIKSGGDVQVAGHFAGSIVANRLTILPSGSVNGDIRVQTLHIEGDYVGRAEAVALRIGARSNVRGQLIYGELIIHTGAKLHAQCRSQCQSQGRALAVVTGTVAAAVN